ncbi:MAG: VWA domain-containing protein [Betaproteobacteria bacterium]|nr:VWA domain-containing protein [Betaproteobacteria bacterium]
MSVDDFRRLVQELYLDSDFSTEAQLQPEAPAPVHNVAILVDTSGSMERDDPQLAKLKDSLEQFAAKLATYAARGIRLNVCLIGFSEKITAFFAVENFTEFSSRPEDPFYQAIHGLRACGGTNYQAAFHKAGEWFAACDDEQASSAVFFITDGKPTCYYHDTFTHSIASSKSGVYVYNGTEFVYGGKGRVYYDANGQAVGSNSNMRRYRASEEGEFEVRVGSSLNWCAANAVFAPDSPARRVCCALPEYYVPGRSHYFDASGGRLSEARGAVYRISASGNFEQYRRGAWHDPVGAVTATALDGSGIAYQSLTTKVQGGSGVSSGALEAGKSLHACRKIMDGTQRLALYAIGIGSAVDPSMLNSFDTAAQAQILLDTGQLTLVLLALAHADFSAVLPELRTETVPDLFHIHDHGADFGLVAEDSPHGDVHHHAILGEHAEHATALHSADGLLSTIDGNLLGDGSDLLIGGSFSAAPVEQSQAAEVRHVSFGDAHLDLPDLFGEDATVDYLLSRVTASQETMTVNGETFENVVLHVHAGDGAVTPIVQTVVLEGVTHPDTEIQNDLHILLHHLLHG